MEEPAGLFRDLCENAYDLIQCVSPDGKFLYVNRAWLATLGYERNELSRLNVFDVIHPDSRAHCEAMMGEVLAGRPASLIEAVFQTKDGRRIDVEGSATCRFVDGQPTATRGIFRDVTARKRAEEELDRLFDLSLDLLCIAGTDGYFKQINPAFERVLGYGRDEMLSRSFLEFVHPDDRESTLAEVENLAKGLPVVDFQNRYLAKDGTYRWLAWRSAPLPGQGLIYAVARDITERKRDEEIMARQAEELARSNADLEQFAYVASHDLRAPLRSIANLAEWVEEALGTDLPEKVAEHLKTLRERVRRMETLTDDLLRYSRVSREAGEVSSVDTAELVESLVFLLDPPKGFAVTVAPGMPVIETAKAPLEQVFRNLISNAIKHHDRPDGQIAVSAVDSGDVCEFSVTDDGPGIPREYQDKVFEMFQKLESRDDVEGTGMGLALVKRIVERYGGRVSLASGDGRGAAFRFTWPKRSP